jgi:hypothetical protein
VTAVRYRHICYELSNGVALSMGGLVFSNTICGCQVPAAKTTYVTGRVTCPTCRSLMETWAETAGPFEMGIDADDIPRIVNTNPVAAALILRCRLAQCADTELGRERGERLMADAVPAVKVEFDRLIDELGVAEAHAWASEKISYSRP